MTATDITSLWQWGKSMLLWAGGKGGLAEWSSDGQSPLELLNIPESI
jgi:hypothetical protein